MVDDLPAEAVGEGCRSRSLAFLPSGCSLRLGSISAGLFGLGLGFDLGLFRLFRTGRLLPAAGRLGPAKSNRNVL